MTEPGLLNNTYTWIKDFLLEQGYSAIMANQINLGVNLVLTIMMVIILDRILRKLIITSFRKFSNTTTTSFDDFLAESNFPKYTAHIIPFILFERLIPYIFQDFPGWRDFFMNVTDIYLVILLVWIVRSVIKSTKEYLKTKPYFKDKPLDSYSQIVIIFLWAFGGLVIFSTLTDQDIFQFLATLGAASAIIILMFRDTILGFVASIQVSVNDMVRIGDWITLDKFGADGDVIEINLTTVKVQNFDNTITTIPTYSLISDSFRNWRGMTESGGRRIKRTLYLKSGSVKFLSESDIEKLKAIQLIAPYLDKRQSDINRFNRDRNIDKSIPINGRNQTNLGVFRKYCDQYLQNHPAINKDLLMMTRILPPTTEGIPLEIYAFSSDKVWQNYERIQADILEHLFASISFFDLELHEKPTGSDINRLKI
ncbi:mechanosensitive ion channel family protein [Robertkochia flava]|uniref:mechanosensitive ion channel family protein n=1 Tax=Robertkochia flava TaxID=3447986 RepID=UPI001CCAE6A7|nr:mechanosensitive ion channel domain-containing protein [Robertkochia marina]